MKKIDYKRREFLSPNELLNMAAISQIENTDFENSYYFRLSITHEGDDVSIVRVIASSEQAEEAAATLARLQDHISALRSEVINLKFDQNKQSNEPV